jgi:nickel-dependent lactate racemase
MDRKFEIPYHKGTMEIAIPAENLIASIHSKVDDYMADLSELELVVRALDNPVASPPLEELARNAVSIVVISSDHTRPVPSKIIMPQILKRIRSGNPDAVITILIATGFHRGTTVEELVDKFGPDIVEKEKIVIHDSRDEAMLVDVGTLPSGGKLRLNKLAMECDLLVAEGFIEPHFFAGFSGGRKSVLPGVAAAETVLANHCAEFISSDCARTGVLQNNPMHKDMLYAANAANLQFIVNVVINGKKEIINAVAGAHEAAHLAGCEFLSGLCRANSPQADIVITSNGGYPLDQNLYQAVKGMTAAEAACNDNGVIIMIAGCANGHGGESFYRSMAEAESPQALYKEACMIPRDRTKPDQWEYQILCRILCKHRVIMVTDLCSPEMIREMHMEQTPDFQTALRLALSDKGADAKIAVIPDGVSVIVEG